MMSVSIRLSFFGLGSNYAAKNIKPVKIKNVSCSASDDQTLIGFQHPRLVAKKVLANSHSVGEGAILRCSIGRPELKSLDPFLLLDEVVVSPPAEFPDHPHRGFESITYVLQGGIAHQDFGGHKGTLHAGDAQVTTVGRGIVHKEMPAGEGTHSALKLWINLSSNHKMIEPRHQELLCDDIPKAQKDGVQVRVVAGEAMGARSPLFTRTPTMFLDFTMSPGSEHHQSIPESWNAFVYVIGGEGVFGVPDSKPSEAHHVLVLGPGEGLSSWNNKYSSGPLRFILVGGQPLNEPVVRNDLFAMSTQAEIEKTMEDYCYGRNGFEMAKHWRSE